MTKSYGMTKLIKILVPIHRTSTYVGFYKQKCWSKVVTNYRNEGSRIVKIELPHLTLHSVLPSGLLEKSQNPYLKNLKFGEKILNLKIM